MKRIYHPWWKWECYKAGFYNTKHIDKSIELIKNEYTSFFIDEYKFKTGLKKVITEWKYSCEHFLSNPNINRIAWLGQAAVCIYLNLPSKYKYFFRHLSLQEQIKANKIAKEFLNKWINKYKNI